MIISLKQVIPYKERLLKLKLPTLKYRRMREDMIEVFNFFYIITSDVVLETRVLVSMRLEDKNELGPGS